MIRSLRNLTDTVAAVLAARRYDQILEMLRERGVAEVRAPRATCSAVSTRPSAGIWRHWPTRDGLSRVRGGARADGGPEPPFAQVVARPHADKDAIADAAAELVSDGDVVLLDIGTTVHGWRPGCAAARSRW